MIAGARLRKPSPEALAQKSGLIFVHGVGSTAAIWDRQLDALGEKCLCAAVELRGNGTRKPDPDPSTISRAGYAQDVLIVADALGIERFTIVGCSLGGVVAFELWRKSPHRIRAMLLLGTFARYPDGRHVANEIAAQARAAGTMRAFGELRAAKLGLPANRLNETVEQYACKSLDCFIAATHATWTGDYETLLPSIDVPALVTYGERDTVAPRPLAQAIASNIPNADLAMIPAAGHVANADNPQAFNAMLRAFLQRAP